MEKVVAKAQTWFTESWEKERLKDGGVTSASNESSVVLYGDFGEGSKVLLTGDAGIRALSMASYYAEQYKLKLKDFTFIQIPHHGSRRNVGPTIWNVFLDRFKLKKVQFDFQLSYLPQGMIVRTLEVGAQCFYAEGCSE